MIQPRLHRLRELKPGQRFRLKRTGNKYEFLGCKRDTPGGTLYVVLRIGHAAPTTLHPSCQVEILEEAAK